MLQLWTLWTARTLSLLWACWWVFFEGAEGVGSGNFGQAIIFAVAMLGVVALAWKWPLAGGSLLILEALAAIFLFSGVWSRHFSGPQIGALLLLMPGPPLVSGILFCLSSPKLHRQTG